MQEDRRPILKSFPTRMAKIRGNSVIQVEVEGHPEGPSYHDAVGESAGTVHEVVRMACTCVHGTSWMCAWHRAKWFPPINLGGLNAACTLDSPGEHLK